MIPPIFIECSAQCFKPVKHEEVVLGSLEDVSPQVELRRVLVDREGHQAGQLARRLRRLPVVVVDDEDVDVVPSVVSGQKVF